METRSNLLPECRERSLPQWHRIGGRSTATPRDATEEKDQSEGQLPSPGDRPISFVPDDQTPSDPREHATMRRCRKPPRYRAFLRVMSQRRSHWSSALSSRSKPSARRQSPCPNSGRPHPNAGRVAFGKRARVARLRGGRCGAGDARCTARRGRAGAGPRYRRHIAHPPSSSTTCATSITVVADHDDGVSGPSWISRRHAPTEWRQVQFKEHR